MKIIKHGKNPEPKILRFECPKCGCGFEIENKDIEEIGCKRACGKLEIVAYGMTCPECGERVAFYV